MAYSALLQIMARASVQRVLAFAPQVDPDRHRMKLCLAITFPPAPSMCSLYVSCLFSFTPRYLGCGLKTVACRGGGGANGSTSPGIQDRGHQESEIKKITFY